MIMLSLSEPHSTQQHVLWGERCDRRLGQRLFALGRGLLHQEAGAVTTRMVKE